MYLLRPNFPFVVDSIDIAVGVLRIFDHGAALSGMVGNVSQYLTFGRGAM